MNQVHESIRAAIFGQNSRLSNEEFSLSEIPNSGDYSNEPLRQLEDLGTGLLVMTVDKSSAIIGLRVPGIIDDRTSRNELINLSLRGPFVYDPEGKYLCCLLLDEDSSSLAVIDIKNAFVHKLDHKLPGKDVTVTPFAYVVDKFILFVGQRNIRFEQDTYYIYRKDDRLFDLRKIDEQPADFIYEVFARRRPRLMPGTSISLGMSTQYSLQIDGIDSNTFINDFQKKVMARVSPSEEEIKIERDKTPPIEGDKWIMTTGIGKITIMLTQTRALIAEEMDSGAISEINAILQEDKRFIRLR